MAFGKCRFLRRSPPAAMVAAFGANAQRSQEDRPGGRQSAGQLLQPDQAVGRGLRQGEGHQDHHRRRQGRRGDPGQPDPGSARPEHRRADLHPGRRDRRAVPVKAAHAAGIPVINVDRNADGAPGDTFIATDSVNSAKEVCDLHRQAGRRQGRDAHHPRPEGHHARSRPPKGCAEALTAYPDIKVVGELWSEGWHQDEGFKLTQDLLQAQSEDQHRLGPGRRAGARRRPGGQGRQSRSQIWVAGFDGDTAALKALKDGVFDVTADPADAEDGPHGASIRRSSWWQARRCRPSSCCPRR